MEPIELTPKRFEEVTGYAPDPRTVKFRISLGVADHVKNEIPVREDFAPIPCLVYEISDRGTILGNSRHSGLVYALTWDEVLELWGKNYNENWIYINIFGANEGTRLDMEHEDDPVCEDCISAVCGDLFEYRENIAKEEACWSCCQMIDEDLNRKRVEQQYRTLQAGEYR